MNKGVSIYKKGNGGRDEIYPQAVRSPKRIEWRDAGLSNLPGYTSHIKAGRDFRAFVDLNEEEALPDLKELYKGSSSYWGMPRKQEDKFFRSTIRPAAHPWELEKSRVEVIKSYDAIIVDDENDCYAIEFIDYDGSIVEADLPKKEFKDLPHPVKIGTHFFVVVYRMKDFSGMSVRVWPVAKFWHPSWKKSE